MNVIEVKTDLITDPLSINAIIAKSVPNPQTRNLDGLIMEFEYDIYIDCRDNVNTINAITSTQVTPLIDLTGVDNQITIKDVKDVLTFITNIQTIQYNPNIILSLDLIYDTVDDYLLNKQYHIVNYILNTIDIKLFNVSLLLGFLTITLPLKDKLIDRTKFFDEVSTHLEEIDPENKTALLKGLK